MLNITRLSAFGFIKFSLLGQIGWHFFPTKKEKELYKRVTEAT